ADTIASASRSASPRLRLYSASSASASSRTRLASSSSVLMRAARLSSPSRIIRCAPTFTSTPMKITNATATQKCASARMCMARPPLALALEGGVDGRRDRRIRRGNAGEPRHDRGRGLGRDAAHVGHGGRLGAGDLLLGVGEAGVELLFQALAVAVG